MLTTDGCIRGLHEAPPEDIWKWRTDEEKAAVTKDRGLRGPLYEGKTQNNPKQSWAELNL